MDNTKWNRQTLQEESAKYKTRTEFHNKSKWAYEKAHKLGIFDEICSHMPKHVDQSGPNAGRFKWTFEKMLLEALKYNSRIEFKTQSNGAYSAALRNGIMDEICKHMSHLLFSWTEESVFKEALKYNSRLEFQKKNKGAYNFAINNKILERACSHMKRPPHKPRPLKWTMALLSIEAQKYSRRVDFWAYSNVAYSTCVKRGILNDICEHMLKSTNSSLYERELMFEILKAYPSAKTLKDYRVDIKNKPYIKGFHIDIYVPELKLGIEFDGTHYHSFDYMRKDLKKSKWSDEDIRNYHDLKDTWFWTSKGIKILHIKEEEWKQDKEACIRRCLDFLRIK